MPDSDVGLKATGLSVGITVADRRESSFGRAIWGDTVSLPDIKSTIVPAATFGKDTGGCDVPASETGRCVATVGENEKGNADDDEVSFVCGSVSMGRGKMVSRWSYSSSTTPSLVTAAAYKMSITPASLSSDMSGNDSDSASLICWMSSSKKGPSGTFCKYRSDLLKGLVSSDALASTAWYARASSTAAPFVRLAA